jgi:hypothetical protein
MPETARSAKQAEQGVEAIGEIITVAAPFIDEIDDEAQREKLREAFKKVITLVQSARLSLQPVLAYLGDGKEIKVETTVKEAVASPEVFATKAALQAGRAAIEVEDRLTWTDMFLQFLDPSAIEGIIMNLSLLLTGSGAAGYVAIRIFKTIKTYKEALIDQVMYTKKTKELDASDPDDAKEIDRIKEQEAMRQKARGTKPIIDEALQKVKDGSHA